MRRELGSGLDLRWKGRSGLGKLGEEDVGQDRTCS